MERTVSNNKKLFSVSIGGFKKSEVIEYIEELNRKAKMSKEQTDFDISRLRSEISELEKKVADFEMQTAELAQTKEKLESSDSENTILRSDVENQREVIESLQSRNDELSEKLAVLEKDYYSYKEKAEQYDADMKKSGGILERTKTEAARMLASANAESAEIIEAANNSAREKAEKIAAESEKLVADNLKKVKYLYKRRDELLSAFEKVKDAAGGFYDNIASTLSKDIEE